MRLWASNPRLKQEICPVSWRPWPRAPFTVVSPYTTERSTRPPIARPACRRSSPQWIVLGLSCGSTPTANAAAFVSCLRCARQEPQVPSSQVSPADACSPATRRPARLECYPSALQRFTAAEGVSHKPRCALAVGVNGRRHVLPQVISWTSDLGR